MIVAITSPARVTPAAPLGKLNAAYVQALQGAGLLFRVIPPLDDVAEASAVLSEVAALVLTGGVDVDPARYGAAPHSKTQPPYPARDASEIALIAAAREAALPTLAICRGMQILNVALGGTLVQDIASQRPTALLHTTAMRRDERAHRVSVQDDSRLAAVIGATEISVNSFHHQALDRVAATLRVVATAPDSIIEGVETAAGDPWWVLGVQWHPEELVGDPEPWDRKLFAALTALPVSTTVSARR